LAGNSIKWRIYDKGVERRDRGMLSEACAAGLLIRVAPVPLGAAKPEAADVIGERTEKRWL
jgi:hypothetical protein